MKRTLRPAVILVLAASIHCGSAIDPNARGEDGGPVACEALDASDSASTFRYYCFHGDVGGVCGDSGERPTCVGGALRCPAGEVFAFQCGCQALGLAACTCDQLHASGMDGPQYRADGGADE